MSENEMSDAKREARFGRWEKFGLERIKDDLLSGGHKLVGGSLEVRELAWEWVRQKEKEMRNAKSEDVVQLKPTIYGIGIDLKALWRKLRGKQRAP